MSEKESDQQRPCAPKRPNLTGQRPFVEEARSKEARKQGSKKLRNEAKTITRLGVPAKWSHQATADGCWEQETPLSADKVVFDTCVETRR